MLLVAMNFAVPMIGRINRMWTDTHKHQFAIDELSNQMDALVRLNPDQVNEALQDLQVTDAFRKSVPKATIAGELSKDDLGQRVTLSLSWQVVKDAKPIQLSGWLMGENDSDQGDSQ